VRVPLCPLQLRAAGSSGNEQQCIGQVFYDRFLLEGDADDNLPMFLEMTKCGVLRRTRHTTTVVVVGLVASANDRVSVKCFTILGWKLKQLTIYHCWTSKRTKCVGADSAEEQDDSARRFPTTMTTATTMVVGVATTVYQ